MAVSEAKMSKMLVRIALGGGLSDVRARGIVTNQEEEEVFLNLQKDMAEIKALGGGVADMGLASWTED